MRVLGVLCAFALFLLMITAPAAYSQDDSKPQAQEAPKPKDDKAAKPDNRAPQDDRAKQDEKAQQKEQEKQQKNQEKENKKAQEQQDRNIRDQQRDQHPVDNRPAENRPMDNRQTDNRPADNRQEMGRDQNHPAADRGRHISDDQFRAHFGREHTFHVRREQVVNVSQPVVVYGGYSFELVDAWPSDWSYDDDCYVDYIDGEYFLFDIRHPGIRIAVFVVG